MKASAHAKAPKVVHAASSRRRGCFRTPDTPALRKGTAHRVSADQYSPAHALPRSRVLILVERKEISCLRSGKTSSPGHQLLHRVVRVGVHLMLSRHWGGWGWGRTGTEDRKKRKEGRKMGKRGEQRGDPRDADGTGRGSRTSNLNVMRALRKVTGRRRLAWRPGVPARTQNWLHFLPSNSSGRM